MVKHISNNRKLINCNKYIFPKNKLFTIYYKILVLFIYLLISVIISTINNNKTFLIKSKRNF